MPAITLKQLPAYAEQLGMDNTELLESFFFACKLKNCTPKTLSVYGERLSYLVKWAAPQGKELDQITKHDLQSYLTSLIDKVAVITINGRIIVYKVFYHHLKDEGYIETNPMENISKMKEPITIKEVVTPDELSKVLGQFDRRTFHSSRDFCLILLTFDAMLRLNEVLSIKTEQLDLKSGLLKVHGKGNKERFVAFSALTARALHSYLTRFRKNIGGDLLFCTREGKRLQYRQAHRIFEVPAKHVGIHLHPHLARHSGATQFVRSGGSLAVLQRILGHSTLAVTERYVHMNDLDILNAYEQHSPAADVRV